MPASVLAPRRTAFATMRLAGLAVGTLAAAAGVAYLIVAVAGSEVWWFGGGAGGSGGFVTFPLPLRVLNASAVALWCATVAGMAFVFSSLARSLRGKVRFARAVSRSAWSLAIVLATGSTAAQIVQNVARGSALVIENGIEPANPIGAPIGWATDPSVLMPNLPMLGLSLVLAVLASVVSAGEPLQRDADGLV